MSGSKKANVNMFSKWFPFRCDIPSSAACLVWQRSDGDPIRHMLDKTRRILIGRDPGRDVRIPRKTVSGLHAVIYHEASHYWLIDAGSTNGTHVREHRLEPHVRVRLRHGDKIRFADESCQFLYCAGNHDTI